MSHLLSLFATAIVLVSAPAFAADQETITDPKAFLSFSYCPDGVMDCGDSVRINVKGKSYHPVGNTETIKKQLETAIGAHQFHKVKASGRFSVTGYTQTRENKGGWGPRTYTVFVITQSTLSKLPLPKGMPSRR